MSNIQDPFARPAQVVDAVGSDDVEAKAAADLAKAKLANTVPEQRTSRNNEIKAYSNEELAGLKIEDIDWSRVTEEDILRLPLEARSFQDVPMLSVKPKDSSMVFYYAYCGTADSKANTQGATNVARLKAKGYQFALVDDIQDGQNMLIEGSIGVDGHIRYYDVVLMKISKLQLYQHMKAKIMQSMARTDMEKVNKMAANGAEAFLNNQNSAALAAAKEQGKTISFYNQ